MIHSYRTKMLYCKTCRKSVTRLHLRKQHKVVVKVWFICNTPMSPVAIYSEEPNSAWGITTEVK